MAWRTKCWMMGSPQITDQWSFLHRVRELFARENLCWLSFLLGIAMIWAWAPMRLPSDSKWAQISVYNISTCKGCFGIFLCLLWCDTMKDLWMVQSSCVGISPVSAFTVLSQKRETKGSKLLLTLLREGITFWPEELGQRDFYSCSHTFAQQAAFRRKGEGTDAWKPTTDIKT